MQAPMERHARGRVVLLGDSITQLGFGEGGWAAAVANYYSRRMDVLNRGYAGYNSRWALQLGVDVADAALVTIFFGANDASLKALNPRQHVPLEEYAKNLESLVESRGTSSVVLICAPPIDAAQRLAYQKQRYGDKATGELERTNEQAGEYAAACERVAASMNVPCVNLWRLMQDARRDWPVFLSDGLHLSPEGNRFLAARLLETIAASFPHLAVAPCPNTGNFGSSGSSSALPPDAPWHDLLVLDDEG